MQIPRSCMFGLLALCLGARIAVADPPQFISDPDKYAADVMRLLSDGDVAGMSKTVADTIGKPESADSIKSALNALVSQKIDYIDKVVDNTFGKGLRQIVYYCFVDKIGFIYFRFNYKMSSHGWILANFIFKTETNELFPKDFVDPKS